MYRYGALLVALTLSGSAMAQDGNSRMTISTDRPVSVLVDGTILQYKDGSTSVTAEALQPGRHEVVIMNAFGTKEILNTFVEIPPGHEVRCRYKHRKQYFDCYESVQLVAPAPAAPPAVVTTEVVAAPVVSATVVAPGVSGETTTTTSTTTVSTGGMMGMPMVGGAVVVNEGNGGAAVGVSVGGMMGGVTVTETTTTSTTSTGGAAVVAVQEVPVQALPDKVKMYIPALPRLVHS